MSSTHSMDKYPCDEESFTSASLDSPCSTKECCECNGSKYENESIAKRSKGDARDKGLQIQQQNAPSSSSGIIKKPVIIKFADRKKLLSKEHSSLNKRKQDPIQPGSILQTMSEQRFSTYLEQGPIIESSLNSGSNISLSEYDEQTDTLHGNIDSCSGDEEFDNEMSALAESLTIPTEQWVSNILDNNATTGKNNNKLVPFARSQCKFQDAPTDIDKDPTESCSVSTSSSKTSSVISLNVQLADNENITGLEGSNGIGIFSTEHDPNNKFGICNYNTSHVENNVCYTNENIIREKLLTGHTKTKGSVVSDYDKTNKFKSSWRLKDNTNLSIHSNTVYDKQPTTLVRRKRTLPDSLHSRNDDNTNIHQLEKNTSQSFNCDGLWFIKGYQCQACKFKTTEKSLLACHEIDHFISYVESSTEDAEDDGYSQMPKCKVKEMRRIRKELENTKTQGKHMKPSHTNPVINDRMTEEKYKKPKFRSKYVPESNHNTESKTKRLTTVENLKLDGGNLKLMVSREPRRRKGNGNHKRTEEWKLMDTPTFHDDNKPNRDNSTNKQTISNCYEELPNNNLSLKQYLPFHLEDNKKSFKATNILCRPNSSKIHKRYQEWIIAQQNGLKRFQNNPTSIEFNTSQNFPKNNAEINPKQGLRELPKCVVLIERCKNRSMKMVNK